MYSPSTICPPTSPSGLLSIPQKQDVNDNDDAMASHARWGNGRNPTELNSFLLSKGPNPARFPKKAMFPRQEIAKALCRVGSLLIRDKQMLPSTRP